MIPYNCQSISAEDIAAVEAVLRSDWLTQGPAVPRFESALAGYVGVDHAVAVTNASSALFIACKALGLSQGDIAWTSPNTFVASANCIVACGAQVDFVDIELETYNMDVAHLEEKLIHAEQAGRLPKIVIPVHFAGHSCDMAAIHALSQRYGFRIIEDASHAPGGQYHSRPVGCCEYSDMAVFSFHPVKMITTGEGGAVLTNDVALAESLQLLRSHGVTRDKKYMQHPSDDGWYYEQVNIGYNFRMTDMQAALGSSQLERLDEFVAKRNTIASSYHDMLANYPLQTPCVKPDLVSSYHLYVIMLEHDRRRELYDFMRAANIGVNVHYIPVHTQPYYQALGFRHGQFPNAEHYYKHALSLPLFYKLTEQQQNQVVDVLQHFFN